MENKTVTPEPEKKKPGSTRAVFITLGIGLTALAIIAFAFQIALAIKGTPDKDLATMSVQGIINVAFAAAGYIFGRLGMEKE